MRFTTLLVVAALLMLTAAVYANGVGTETTPTSPSSGEVTQPNTPTTEEGTTTEPTTPTGTGPSTSTSTTTTTTTTVAPPTGAMATTPEVDQFNSNFVVSSFGVDRNSVASLRQAGWSWGDIYLLANVANKTNRPILEIANWRSQGLSWNDIANRYNMTAMDITTPSLIETRVAGFVGEYGYQPLYYKTDPWGNPVLTKYEADRLSRMGYDWRSIAVAANISSRTGANIQDVLSWIDRGYTWPQVAREYGVSYDRVSDVSQYPFARQPGTIGTMTTTTPVGAGPSGRRGLFRRHRTNTTTETTTTVPNY